MAKKHLNPNQLPLFVPDSNWRPPSQLPRLDDIPFVALDTETNDPDLLDKGPSWFRGGGHLAGISLAWDGGQCYLPIGHKGGDNLDKTMVLGYIEKFLRNYKGTLVLMHGMYDLGWLRYEGIAFPQQCKIWDVMMVEALLDEHKLFYNLNSIASTYNLPQKNESLLREAAAAYSLDPKKDMWMLPGRFVGAYAEADAQLPLEIYKHQKPLIEKNRLERVLELEHSLLPLLQEMKFRGVRVDIPKAERLANEFMAKHDDLVGQVKYLTGYSPDIWSNESCGAVLTQIGLTFPTTPTGKPKVTRDWLLDHEHEVPRLIGEARKFHKAANTFCRGMIIGHADKNDRVHCSFHPLKSDDGGTVSGRFSSSDPNLQQVPARDPEMNRLIRGLFLPEHGEKWCAIDYSQQEPRLTVHYAVERGCTRAQEAANAYNTDINTDYHNLVAAMMFGNVFTLDERKKAKTINLGLAYGMGGAKLARALGLPTEWRVNSYTGRKYEAAGPEAQDLLNQYHNAVPYIKELSNEYSRVAENTGQIRTLSGRLCRFPLYEPKKGGRALPRKEAIDTYGLENIKRSFTYTALNRKIQGGSADMIKVSLRNLWNAGFVPLVTVHDENGLSVPNEKKAKEAEEIMCNCVKLHVPLKVDIDFGDSWGTATPLEEED